MKVTSLASLFAFLLLASSLAACAGSFVDPSLVSPEPSGDYTEAPLPEHLAPSLPTNPSRTYSGSAITVFRGI